MTNRKASPSTERATATAKAQGAKAKQAAITQAFDLGFKGSRADAATLEADCNMFKAHATKGKVPDHVAKAYKAGVIAERLDMAPDDAETLAYCMGLTEKGAKRTSSEQAAILAANNRYSRRLTAADLASSNPAGRSRGTKATTTKATATKAQEPANKATATKAQEPDAQKPAKAAQPLVPTLVNEAEVVAYLGAKLAEMKTAQRKNAKAFTAKTRAAIKAFEAAMPSEK